MCLSGHAAQIAHCRKTAVNASLHRQGTIGAYVSGFQQVDSASAWLSHSPRATTEANTLRCIAEVPVFVYYLIFPPPTIPWVPDSTTARQHQTECGLV
jgi:hypothetical protein